ncbi:unnamed protein product, partial [Acanthoscelides obtectus]
IITGSINGDQYAQNGLLPQYQHFGRQRVYGKPNFVQRQQNMFQPQQNYPQPRISVPQVLRSRTSDIIQQNSQQGQQLQQPQQYPHAILGPNGVPLETPEVIAARELHFQLKAMAEMQNMEERMRRENREIPHSAENEDNDYDYDENGKIIIRTMKRRYRHRQ